MNVDRVSYLFTGIFMLAITVLWVFIFRNDLIMKHPGAPILILHIVCLIVSLALSAYNIYKFIASLHSK